MNSQIEVMKQKKGEAQQQAQSIVPILNLIIEKTKELQQEVSYFEEFDENLCK